MYVSTDMQVLSGHSLSGPSLSGPSLSGHRLVHLWHVVWVDQSTASYHIYHTKLYIAIQRHFI